MDGSSSSSSSSSGIDRCVYYSVIVLRKLTVLTHCLHVHLFRRNDLVFVLATKSATAARSEKSKRLHQLVTKMLQLKCSTILTVIIKSNGAVEFDSNITQIYQTLFEDGKEVICQNEYSRGADKDRAIITFKMELFDCVMCSIGVSNYPDLGSLSESTLKIRKENVGKLHYDLRGLSKLSLSLSQFNDVLYLSHLRFPRGYRESKGNKVRVVHISKFIGYGLVAGRHLYKAEVFSRYYGEVVLEDEGERRLHLGGDESKYLVRLDDGRFLDGYPYLEKAPFKTLKFPYNVGARMNSCVDCASCLNSEIKDVLKGSRGKYFVEVAALKDVSVGDALLANYPVPGHIHKCNECEYDAMEIESEVPSPTYEFFCTSNPVINPTSLTSSHIFTDTGRQ